ncbi:MAG: methionyl aminopeptidase [Flavobacteriaceae bacterium]
MVTLDCGLCHKGYHTDSALTVPVGKIDKAVQQLLWDTNESLYKGIEMMRAGNTVGDVGHAIESFVDDRYGIIRVLCGHGIGKEVHEEPQVPNYGKKGTGAVLKAGMVIAVEPMLTLGSEHAVSLPDEYTFVTEDESPSAHFEHTILVTDGDPEILTERI